jgi:hypothetical protein
MPALFAVANVQDPIVATTEHSPHQLVVAGVVSKSCSRIGAQAGAGLPSLQAMGVQRTPSLCLQSIGSLFFS